MGRHLMAVLGAKPSLGEAGLVSVEMGGGTGEADAPTAANSGVSTGVRLGLINRGSR